MIICLVDLCMEEPTTICVVDTGASKVLLSLSMVDTPLQSIAEHVAAGCRSHKPAELWVSSPFAARLRLQELFWSAGVPRSSEGGPTMLGLQ